jgi:hypothetical protein
LIRSANVTNQSFGLVIYAGTTSSDAPLRIFNVANTATLLNLTGTGNLTINAQSSGPALTLNPANGYTGITISANNTAGQSYGLYINAGTNTSDYAIKVANAAQTSNLFLLDGAGNITARGVGYCVAKGATTTRTNNTLTIDPDLQVGLALGTYAFELYIQNGGTMPGGFKFTMEYSGTDSEAVFSYVGNVNGATATAAQTAFATNITVTTSAAGDWYLIKGQISATGAGTLALYWAENSTNATGSQVTAGSYMKVVPV